MLSPWTNLDDPELSESTSHSRIFDATMSSAAYFRTSFQFKYLIALCIGAVTFIFVVNSLASFVNLTPTLPLEEIHHTMEKLKSVRQCVLRESQRFQGSVWQRLHIIVTTCVANSAFSHRRYSFINFLSDKSFLPFRALPVDSCNAITLGVGDEITYETLIKQKYPKCNFYGADPYPETGGVFKSVGKIFFTAIDNVTSRDHYLHVLRNGTYDWRSGVEVTSLGDFIRTTARVRLVHFLSMDIEGAEYRVTPYLTNAGAFRNESGNAIICQISAEFHGPLSYYNISISEFESIWIKLLVDSPYVPMRALPPGYHHRFHLFNMEDEECVRLFLI